MNFEAISATAESLGALGVILSVLYLAYEVRSNTRTMRADAGTKSQMEWSRYNLIISEHQDRDTIVRIFDPNEKLDNFSDKERTAITFAFRAFAQQVEAQYFQYKANLLDPEVWEARLTSFSGLVQFPASAEWWADESTLPIYTKSFLDCVESVGRVELSQTTTIGTGTQKIS